MARTISKMTLTQEVDYLILRSVMYQQRLPAELYLMTANVSERLRVLSKLEYLNLESSSTKLTETGIKYLLRLNGGIRPPMIDVKTEALMSELERSKPLKIKEPTVKEILQSASFRGPS